jgi:hypothetical protein
MTQNPPQEKRSDAFLALKLDSLASLTPERKPVKDLRHIALADSP